MSDSIIDITVTVVESPDGGGNVGNGDYSYTFAPDVVTVTESNTILRYSLDAESAAVFSITGLYSTDSRFQLGTAQIAADAKSLDVLNANSQPQLMYVALQVVHIVTQRNLSCDPQVINVPPNKPTMC